MPSPPETPKRFETQRLGPMKGPKMPRAQSDEDAEVLYLDSIGTRQSDIVPTVSLDFIVLLVRSPSVRRLLSARLRIRCATGAVDVTAGGLIQEQADSLASVGEAAIAASAAIQEAADSLVAAGQVEVLKKPKAPPADSSRRLHPPAASCPNLPEIALSKGLEIPYFPLRPQQKVPDVTPEKAVVPKPERKPVNRANLMKAIAVAMLMLEDL